MEKERISRLVTEVSDYAKKLRNQFHMNPELSDQGIEQACRYAEEAMQKLINPKRKNKEEERCAQ